MVKEEHLIRNTIYRVVVTQNSNKGIKFYIVNQNQTSKNSAESTTESSINANIKIILKQVNASTNTSY